MTIGFTPKAEYRACQNRTWRIRLALRTVIDIKLSSSSMPSGTQRFLHGAYSGPADRGASLPGPRRAANEPPTQGDNQLVSASVLSQVIPDGWNSAATIFLASK